MTQGARGAAAVLLESQDFTPTTLRNEKIHVPHLRLDLRRGRRRPDEGIPPGTKWEDVPPNWTCPECGARKEDFELIEF